MDGNENQSASLGALAAALAKAQGQMRKAKEDSENPHFRSKYADLASIWEACREPLSANGLAVMQRVSTNPEGVTVTTQLLHSSGEWVKDSATFPVAQKTPQGIGAAITYARRYSLAALVGVAAGEDDDGNADSLGARQQEKRAPRQASAKVAKEETKAAPLPPEPSGKATEEAALKTRRLRLWKAAEKAGATQESFKTWASQCLGVAKPSTEITAEDCAKLEAELARGFQVIAEPPPESAKPAPSEEEEITGEVMLARIATEFGMSLADVMKRAQGVCNGKKSNYSLADAKAVRDSLGAIPKGAK